MHERAGDSARAFRELSQMEMMTRVRKDLDQMMGILEPLTEEEWTSMIVPHFYMGPVPAFIYAAGQLMDYGVHTPDPHGRTRQGHAPSARASHLLSPLTLIFWQVAVRPQADLATVTLSLTR